MKRSFNVMVQDWMKWGLVSSVLSVIPIQSALAAMSWRPLGADAMQNATPPAGPFRPVTAGMLPPPPPSEFRPVPTTGLPPALPQLPPAPAEPAFARQYAWRPAERPWNAPIRPAAAPQTVAAQTMPLPTQATAPQSGSNNIWRPVASGWGAIPQPPLAPQPPAPPQPMQPQLPAVAYTSPSADRWRPTGGDESVAQNSAAKAAFRPLDTSGQDSARRARMPASYAAQVTYPQAAGYASSGYANPYPGMPPLPAMPTYAPMGYPQMPYAMAAPPMPYAPYPNAYPYRAMPYSPPPLPSAAMPYAATPYDADLYQSPMLPPPGPQYPATSMARPGSYGSGYDAAYGPTYAMAPPLPPMPAPPIDPMSMGMAYGQPPYVPGQVPASISQTWLPLRGMQQPSWMPAAYPWLEQPYMADSF